MTAQEDVFHHVHDLLAIPLFLLFIVAAVIRLPRVCQLLRLQRQRAVTTDALLLNVDEVLSGLPPPPKSGVLCLRAFHLFCCASLVGIYVALLSVPPSDSSLVQVGQVAGVAMWALCALLVFAELRARAHAGRSLRAWWILNLVVASYHLYFDLDDADQQWPHLQTELVLKLAGFVPSALLGIAAALEPDSPNDLAYARDEEAPTEEKGLPENLEATASFASRVTFAWMTKLLKLGRERALEHSDLFMLQTVDATKWNEMLLQRAWASESQGPRKSYLHAWHAAFGRYFWTTGFFKLINDVMNLLNPILINTIVDYIDGGTTLSHSSAVLCAFAMLGTNTLKSFANNQYFFRGFRLGLRTRVAVGQHVYGKALSLVHEQRNEFGVGAIVSFMQIDASKIADALPYLHLTWSGPMILVVATLMLYQYLGYAGLAGFGVMVITMPLNGLLAKNMQKFVMRTMKARDARVKFTNELLQGVRIIKLFAWEDALLSQLHAKREEELLAVRDSMLFSSLFMFVFTATPLIVTAVTFVLYAALNGELTAAKAFTSLSLFNILRFPLSVVPMMITRVIDLTVVNKRLSKFFNSGHLGTQILDDDAAPYTPFNGGGEGGGAGEGGTGPLAFEGHYTSRRAAPRGGMAIELAGCTFRWPEVKKEEKGKGAGKGMGKGMGGGRGGGGRGGGRGGGGGDKKKKPGMFAGRGARRAFAAEAKAEEEAAAAKAAARPPTLSGLSMKVAQGSFVGVCGPVGCGKSSLLSALLGDIPRLAGRVAVRGHVAFCSQEPWIQNMTFRDNILFGHPYDARLYAQVLSACALDADVRQLEGGDSCEIGERGINLSGGQKARVALARACYAMADVVLLDDVLSAVDAEVGAHLMSKCIRGLLAERGATVVLVTHHTHFLADVDLLVELAEGGTVTRQGKPADINWAPRGGSSQSLADAAGAPSAAPNGDAPPKNGKAPAAAAAASAVAEGGAAAKEPATPGTVGVKKFLSEQDKMKAEGGKKGGQLMTEEDRERGVVKANIWLRYGASLGVPALVTLLFMHAANQALTFGSSWWLGEWARDGLQFNCTKSLPPGKSEGCEDNPNHLPLATDDGVWFYILIYVVVSVSAALIILVRAVIQTFASLHAGRRVHTAAANAVFATPMSFFDTTPLGRILNRFSGDVQKVDTQLCSSGNSFVNLCASLLGTLALLVLNSWWIVCLVPVLGVGYLRVAQYYRNSARELQRLDSVSKSPIYAAFSEALGGAATIQAYGRLAAFEADNRRRFDKNLRAGFVSAVANRWLSVRLDIGSNLLLTFTALAAVVTHIVSSEDSSVGNGQAAAMAGLALAYAPGLTDTLSFLIRQFTTLETDMVSAERLFSFAKLPPEETKQLLGSLAPVDAAWPHAGAIEFTGVKMAYREGLKPVLEDLDLSVRAGEKVGLVGRTGAGKSSILVCLYRLVELSGGSITIDGRDIAGVPLKTLRARLSIIPQDPVLFTGSLRRNLDPFDECADAQLRDALERCGILSLVNGHADGLQRPLEEKGGNLSMGQRQLVCMARALLKASRVLVLDEATASVDLETDDLIQTALRTQLDGVSVVTIAHRLDTIMHCDRVVVMDAGKAVESGPPLELREQAGGRFAELWASRT